jgi:hypothetical protein
MKNRSLVELILFLAIAPGISNAETIYSSFLPGQTYQCCAGQFVSGPTATFAGTLTGQKKIAAAFTPNQNYILTQIAVAFYFPNGPNMSRFNLSLNQDSGGVPGVTEHGVDDRSFTIWRNIFHRANGGLIAQYSALRWKSVLDRGFSW